MNYSLLYLFLWFIYNQFSSIAYASALNHALNYHIFKIINKSEILKHANYHDICIKQNKIIPSPIDETRQEYEEHFKNLSLINKIFFIYNVLFYVIFNNQIKIGDDHYKKDDIKLYSTILQSSLSSWFIIIMTLTFCLYANILFYVNILCKIDRILFFL